MGGDHHFLQGFRWGACFGGWSLALKHRKDILGNMSQHVLFQGGWEHHTIWCQFQWWAKSYVDICWFPVLEYPLKRTKRYQKVQKAGFLKKLYRQSNWWFIDKKWLPRKKKTDKFVYDSSELGQSHLYRQKLAKQHPKTTPQWLAKGLICCVPTLHGTKTRHHRRPTTSRWTVRIRDLLGHPAYTGHVQYIQVLLKRWGGAGVVFVLVVVGVVFFLFFFCPLKIREGQRS